MKEHFTLKVSRYNSIRVYLGIQEQGKNLLKGMINNKGELSIHQALS